MKIKFIAVFLLFATLRLCAQTVENVSLPAWSFGGFVRPPHVNPVIWPDTASRFISAMNGGAVDWESNDTFNPAAIVKKGKIVVLYRAEDKSGTGIGGRTSRIGYAESSDGLHFSRRSEPVLFPAEDNQKEFEWPGGCEDPRVAVTKDGLYMILYTQWNRKTPHLAVATSRDLIHWTKYGPVFRKAFGGKFFNMPTKSASIVTKVVHDVQVITKVNGKYLMYWGEANVYAATSDDLINWQPLVDNNGNLRKLISPRKGYFDSNLTECGPPAVMTDKGILLFYNGKNAGGENGDKRFTAKSYCAGQVLFDLNDPTKVIGRLDVPFLHPMESFEKSGQYIDGTVFIEGLTFFKKKWYLYYGCADSRVAVAVYDPQHPAAPDPIKSRN